MSAVAKIFLDPSIKFIPQMDFSVKYTENGGIEAAQTFLARKSDLTPGSPLGAFVRGARWDVLYPQVPPIYGHLTLKTFDPDDHSPGIISIKSTFTGVQFGAGGGSSGDEASVPTTSLRGNLEEAPITQCEAWDDLDDAAKARLGWLMTLPGVVSFDTASNTYGRLHDDGDFEAFPTEPGIWVEPGGDELKFARMIAQGRTTYKVPSWSYVYRTESKDGFAVAQLNLLGKIVGTPPGNPPRPNSGWTWMLVGPEQDQSGPARFVRDLTFQLIPKNDENDMLYGS